MNKYLMMNDDKSKLNMLSKAFDTFNEASSKLSSSYEGLKSKIDELNLELEGKNKELEENLKKIKRLEELSERRHRLIAMGEMAAKVAHEIRNPLGSMELFSSILKKELKHDPHNLEIVEHIISGIRTMDNVISNLLMFTKSAKSVLASFDLPAFLDELIRFTQNVLEQQPIQVKRCFDEDANELYGDRELLKQVFLNLILNAMQAMPDGGVLTLSTGKHALLMADYGIKINENFTYISVSDTGVGIKDEFKKRIFDPFYTSKEMGTGLGLTIANNIINSHDGNIDACDNVDKGTSFIVSLPKHYKENI